MTTFGMPTSMFLVFVATILAGSLGAIHYVIVHVILGKPFAEILPPVLQQPGGADAPEAPGTSDPGDDRG